MSTPSATTVSIAVRIRNPIPICICGAGWWLCSCAWSPLLICAWFVGVVPSAVYVMDACRRGAAGGGRDISCGASLPGNATRSGRKFPVARSLCRFSNFCHHTLCRLSKDWWKLLLNSCCIRRRSEAWKVGYWWACDLSLGMTPDVSSRRRNISYVAGWTPSSPRNTVQKTAQASSWGDVSSHPAMGANFFFPVRRLVSAKEVKVPPPRSRPTYE